MSKRTPWAQAPWCRVGPAVIHAGAKPEDFAVATMHAFCFTQDEQDEQQANAVLVSYAPELHSRYRAMLVTLARAFIHEGKEVPKFVRDEILFVNTITVEAYNANSK